MSRTINLEDWLIGEQGAYGTGTDTMTGMAGAVPQSDPNMGLVSPAASPQGDPNIANMPVGDMGEPEQDVTDDPQVPDMPEDMGEEVDFEKWKKDFIVATTKGDVEELKQMLLDVRERDLDPYQRKFVEDNYQIILLRENANIDEASKDIRRLLKEEVDHNNPGTSLANHITAVLEKYPLLDNIFIKLGGLYSMKADQHRKFIGALTGSVQVGSGGNNEDLVFNEKDYSIRISTRMNARWGDVYLGDWSLRADDPDRYLKQPELKRLENGSPEEKEALKHRVIIESIAEMFKTRAFYINVVDTDGTIYTLGWDVATSLTAGFTDGKLVVKTAETEDSEAMIDDDGSIIPFTDIRIVFMQETGQMDEEGNPDTREAEFMVRKAGGRLILNAELDIVREASTSFQGMGFKETPWQGNPTDLKALARCVPSSSELILRQC